MNPKLKIPEYGASNVCIQKLNSETGVALKGKFEDHRIQGHCKYVCKRRRIHSGFTGYGQTPFKFQVKWN